MKNDIQLNMSQLADIYENILTFYGRAEQLYDISVRFYDAIMNQTTTELYELAEDWKSNVIPREQQLLARLEKVSELLWGYIREMGSCVTPVDATKMMRVDRADIAFNLEQIKNELSNFIYSPASMMCQFITWDNEEIDATETDPEKLNFYEEAKKKRQRNYEKLSKFQLNFRLNAEIYMESELFRVYNETIVPYEEIDNEYGSLAEAEYRAYVTTHDSGTDSERAAVELLEGFADGVVGTLDSLYTLALATGVLPKSYIPFYLWEDADNRVKEFYMGVLECCLDPIGTLEAIGQGVADTYEEEGLSYMIGGLVFEVVFDYIICKGATKLAKLDELGKLGKVTNVTDGVVDASKPVEDLVDAIRKGEGGGDTSFTWKLRGEDVTLNDVKVQEISYVKRSSTELKTLRDEFNTTTRKAFLEDLGKNAEYLRNAGFSETDILKIQNGRVPDGWQVHHKLPLDDSGTNSFDNLVLIQNEPYHKVITNYQNSVARQMEIGEVQAVQWPMPNGNIYPAQH